MIDAPIHWPDEVDLELWPLAMDHAVWIWNNTPKQGVGFSPLELFSGVRTDHSVLNRLHVWGCPTYVLEPQLQDGKKIPKWNKRSRLGQFLGFSKQHSTAVGLIRNTRTNKILSQFHAVFDDMFSTVSTSFQDPEKSLNKTFSSDEWENIITNGVERYYTDDVEVPPLYEEWLEQTPSEEQRRERINRRFRERNPTDATVQRDDNFEDTSIIESSPETLQ